MKHLFNTFVIGSLLVASVSSCTSKFEDINSNPYQPGDLSADDYALGSAMNNLAGCVVSPDVNTAQFTDCLLGGPLGGYFADSKKDWKATIAYFNPTDDWTRVFLKSDKILPVLFSNLNVVELVSQNTNNPVPLAIAHIIKVAAMHRVSDAYGPIPYSKIGADGSINTPYDSEQEVYTQFFKELNDALAVLNEHPNDRLTASADYIYQGDVKKWIRFANSLKLRLAIRIANVDETTARQMAEEAVNPANGGVIEQNADNAAWSYFSGSVNNPLYVAKEYNHMDGCKTGGDTHVAADIIAYMNGYDDPRREKFFVKSEWSGIDYVGMRRSAEIPEPIICRKYSGINLNPNDPLYWMNAAEVSFLRAEAKAVYGFNMQGEAKDFYENGIRLSFAQWGVDGADDYMMKETKKTITYVDPNDGEHSYDQELTNSTIKWEEGASREEKQERIIIQKWIANWMLGNEAWADYRRTGYPHLFPATVDGNKSGGIVDSNRGARRIPYPAAEYNDNKENINHAVNDYLGGQDNMGRDLWWAKKN